MKRLLLAVFSLLLASHALAGQVPPPAPAPPTTATATESPHVGLSIIRTASSNTLEALLYAGGSWSRQAQVNFSAFLIKHGQSLLLFDTGLGSQVAAQYRQDMPVWARPFFKYNEPVVPAHSQLDQAGMGPLTTIILSHSHWDHASGLVDFAQATVWASAAELAVIRHAGDSFGGAWPSQVGSPTIHWKSLEFLPSPFEGFDTSLDWFGDGSVVLVPLYGHTPGSVGVFVTVDSGHRYFLVGDAVWRAAALKAAQPKFWAARWLVDHDCEQTQQVIEQIRAVVERHPDLSVVPSHDAAVQDSLGYFPAWVK